MTLDSLLAYAYGVQPFQAAGPEWANVDRFDIEAKIPDGVDKKDSRTMLKSLLKDRFKLSFHIEKRELDGYVLIIGKQGEKLKASLSGAAFPQTDKVKGGGVSAKSTITKNPDGSNTIDMGAKGTETIRFDQERSAIHYEISSMTTEQLAERLSGCLGNGGQKVVDETGIKGTYQLAYDCPLPTTQQSSLGTAADGALPSDSRGGSSLSQSLDALGLKLEKRKILIDVYVIDHVDRPSAN